MIQYVLDGAADSAYRDTRLIALLVKNASVLNKTPTLSAGPPGPHHALLVMVLQMHWNDEQLRATRNTLANASSSTLPEAVAGVIDTDIRAICLSLLQPGLTSAPFEPDFDEGANPEESGKTDISRPALDLERTLENSISALDGVNGCLWLRTWIEGDGAIQADCTLSIDYDPYDDEFTDHWRKLKAQVDDVFRSHGIRRHYIDLEVLSDRHLREARKRLQRTSLPRNLIEGHYIRFQDRELQVRRIWEAWQGYRLRRIITHRIQRRKSATYHIDNSIIVAHKAIMIQRWWRRLMGKFKEAKLETFIKKWMSAGGHESKRPLWYDRLSAFTLFVEAPEILERIISELDWEVADPETPILQKGETVKELYWLIEGVISVRPQPAWKLGGSHAGLLNAVSKGPHPFDVAVKEISFIVRLKQRYWDRALKSLPYLETYIEDYGVPIPFYLEQHGTGFEELRAAEFRLWSQLDSCEEPWERLREARRWTDLNEAFTFRDICGLTTLYSPVLYLTARTGDCDLLTFFLNLGAKINRETQDRSLKAIALQNGQLNFAAWVQQQFPSEHSPCLDPL
jgi:hypothetical protein